MEHREEPGEVAWGVKATERVMGAFDARPHAGELLRNAWRLARGLKAPLLAVTVLPQDGRRKPRPKNSKRWGNISAWPKTWEQK